jgi:hypothetical protein
LLAQSAPLILTVLADRVSHLGLGQRLLGGPTLLIELGLGSVLALELLRDGSPAAAQLFEDRLETRLVISPNPLPDGRGDLVPGSIEAREPLFILSALLQ